MSEMENNTPPYRVSLPPLQFNHANQLDGFPDDETDDLKDAIAQILGRMKNLTVVRVERGPTVVRNYSVESINNNRFCQIRSGCNILAQDYLNSLQHCDVWDAKGGKSNSSFARTTDRRFIIKDINTKEFESFVQFSEGYFTHVTDSVNEGKETCLAKVLGIYKVFINKVCLIESEYNLMVMENLFENRIFTRRYDLKGATYNRLIPEPPPDAAEEVRLDQNLVNDITASPLNLDLDAKTLLARAVSNDLTFLASINVMDYSLLVGVDDQGRELVCGIIDYLRQYDFNKQLESSFKKFKYLLITRRKVLPTVIPPTEYGDRLMNFLTHHLMLYEDPVQQNNAG